MVEKTHKCASLSRRDDTTPTFARGVLSRKWMGKVRFRKNVPGNVIAIILFRNITNWKSDGIQQGYAR